MLESQPFNRLTWPHNARPLQAATRCSRKLWAVCLNAKSSEERVVYKKAELNRNVDSENNHGGSSRTYVLHRAGCSQEDDQLLRQGCEWSSSPGRQAWGNAPRAGHLDENSAAALDGGDGGNDLPRLDLRSSPSACDTD